jgi:hypothetical protein
MNETEHEAAPLWPPTDDDGWAFELAPATATALLDLILIASRWPAVDSGFDDE